VINRKLRYLVKWKYFGIEHNSWETHDNVHAPDLVADFHRKHPGAVQHIRTAEFHSIPFRPLPLSIVPGRHFSKGGMDVRGQLIQTSDSTPDTRPIGTKITSRPSTMPTHPTFLPTRDIHNRLPVLNRSVGASWPHLIFIPLLFYDNILFIVFHYLRASTYIPLHLSRDPILFSLDPLLGEYYVITNL
jgi:hypothetical protein